MLILFFSTVLEIKLNHLLDISAQRHSGASCIMILVAIFSLETTVVQIEQYL